MATPATPIKMDSSPYEDAEEVGGEAGDSTCAPTMHIANTNQIAKAAAIFSKPILTEINLDDYILMIRSRVAMDCWCISHCCEAFL
ncbi:hypothetical protein DCAR_0416991 [Daucus carota subsp. sativus]|uniref:Uncharacterized protein n=1 Tax=Daucus carota subsp. sativus TaxID=79200 RepID=A0A165XYB9_DAUCS|nr:hypothetical protein DCAR_0416991 [Daucus carota subsp. sativus]